MTTTRLQQLIAELDQNQQATGGMLETLKPEDWLIQVQPDDATWTVRQMFVHIVDAQRGMTGQLQGVSVGKEVIPPNFDLNRWNRRTVEKSTEKSPDDLRTQYNANHAALRAILSELTDEQLDIRGRHSSLDIMSVEEMIRLIGTHESEHVGQIAAALQRNGVQR